MLQKNNLKLMDKRTFSIQLSNSVYTFKYLLPFYMSCCSCFLKSNSGIKDYQVVNAKYIKPNNDLKVKLQDDSGTSENNLQDKLENDAANKVQDNNYIENNHSPNFNKDTIENPEMLSLNKNIVNCFDNIPRTHQAVLNRNHLDIMSLNSNINQDPIINIHKQESQEVEFKAEK